MKVNGQVYKHPCTLIIALDDDYPVFGELDSILVTNNFIIFQVTVNETVDYVHHFHAYCVSKTPEKRLVSPDHLIDHVPLHIMPIKVDSCTRQVVVLKYHICETLVVTMTSTLCHFDIIIIVCFLHNK